MTDTSSNNGVVISLDNVGYHITVTDHPKGTKVPTKILASIKGATPTRDIVLIKSISGVIHPNRVTALIGPSGAGKSTLLDVISGRKNVGTATGDILFNGRKAPKTFKRLIGYVEQADVLPGTLSVREAIDFTAQMKLTISKAERHALVEKLIADLELQTCADSVIGSRKARGISGGQAKRVNIALELVADPKVLFLDEPTSGLDALTSANLMRIVRKLADGGRTVVVTIHQPSAEVFELIDDVVLLKLGRLAYWGERAASIEYLQGVTKFPFEEDSNPADYLLEALQVTSGAGNLDMKTSSVADVASELTLAEKAAAAGGKDPTDVWGESSVKEAMGTEMVEYLASSPPLAFPEDAKQFANGWGVELGVLTRRAFAMNARSVEFVGSRILGNLVMSLVIGSLYWQISNTQTGLADLASVCFFVTAHLTFSLMQQLPVLLNARPLVFRERSAGCYRVSTYLISTIILEVVFMLVSVTIFTAITFYMVGLNGGTTGWLEMTGYCALALFHSLLLSLLFSVIFPDVDTALAIAPLFLVMFMLLSGFLISKESIPAGWRIIYYISPMRYTLELIMNLQFSGSEFMCKTSELVCAPTGECICPFTSGDTYLKFLSLDGVVVGEHIGVMVGMVVVFFLIGWILLLKKKSVSR